MYQAEDYESKNGELRDSKNNASNNQSQERVIRKEVVKDKDHIKTYPLDERIKDYITEQPLKVGIKLSNSKRIIVNDEQQYCSLSNPSECYRVGDAITVIGVPGLRSGRATRGHLNRDELWFAYVLAIYDKTVHLQWFEGSNDNHFSLEQCSILEHQKINDTATKVIIDDNKYLLFPY
ncbi:hypothetical protein SAMD00019534_125450 [Acytostelium subglobosum LB1]|uniref:hypothetical protein n=1 Tax=Acytostelium subglobosum LB1 TaxID=1410327 RepID=UPI000644F242|nr:hypothetical protein SAMD00019534_125450 [Acytostelium subglobosum LB1]GAM29369.1 hypothetical protein SAMD00019534_125450 [Acytostelium subglobosum LB1]|eukprot:XP_012747674.1 hypothetical protein SAMD00019534_125450 [Acytostelium subglobosum LB1]